jgi:Kef-type K+ transport system membrane component KefB
VLHAFLGSMLAATSVRITARVLKDAGVLRAPFARVILGAAVIDDVPGLLVLAVISGIITAAATGQAVGLGPIVLIMVKAFGFLIGALLLGSMLSPRLFKGALAMRSAGVVQALSLSFCFGLSYLALAAGLAPIVGSFASPAVLGFALVLTMAAIVGKLACAVAVPKGMSGVTVGLGMMPRGEVGLIFAGIGARLLLDGRPAVDAATYAAAVFMVVATTMATPPLLLWAVQRGAGRPPAGA